jgi:DNA-binding transcriptional ArsR family regulator
MLQRAAFPAPVFALVCRFPQPGRRQEGAGGSRVTDLTAELGLAQSTVSAHLACLRDCGLVDVRPAGRASVYSLSQPGLPALLAAAEAVLDATGHAVALCPRYGQAP